MYLQSALHGIVEKYYLLVAPKHESKILNYMDKEIRATGAGNKDICESKD
ncbi:MAG: hypothetical protein ACLU8S_02935 [Coprococcus phoceensis]